MIVYVVIAGMEEMRQLFDTDTLDASLNKNLKIFFNSEWNYVDLIATKTFFIGAATRFNPNWGEPD